MLKSSCTQTLRCGVLESHVTIQEFYPEDIKTNLEKWGASTTREELSAVDAFMYHSVQCGRW